jgi:hypothetical protein
MRWRRRIPGKYRASPVAANGRIYFLNETGLCTIMGASASYDRLAENQLDVEQTFGSPAISNQQLFIRGKEALYCITRY